MKCTHMNIYIYGERERDETDRQTDRRVSQTDTGKGKQRRLPILNSSSISIYNLLER